MRDDAVRERLLARVLGYDTELRQQAEQAADPGAMAGTHEPAEQADGDEAASGSKVPGHLTPADLLAEPQRSESNNSASF